MSDCRVYFVRNSTSGAVKIGVSEDVQQRFRSLQQQSIERLVLLAEIPGDERYEQILHAHFAEYRIKGEWFRFEGRLATFIDLLPSLPPRLRAQPHRRAKAPLKYSIDHDAIDAHWRAQLAVFARAVHEYGLERFALRLGVRAQRLSDALNERGRHHWHGAWTHELRAVTTDDLRREMAEVALVGTGLRLNAVGQLVALPEPEYAADCLRFQEAGAGGRR